MLDIIACGNSYGIAGLVDSEREIGTEIMGHKVLGRDEELPRILKENQIDGGLIAIGDNYVLQKIYRNGLWTLLNISANKVV